MRTIASTVLLAAFLMMPQGARAQTDAGADPEQLAKLIGENTEMLKKFSMKKPSGEYEVSDAEALAFKAKLGTLLSLEPENISISATEGDALAGSMLRVTDKKSSDRILIDLAGRQRALRAKDLKFHTDGVFDKTKVPRVLTLLTSTQPFKDYKSHVVAYAGFDRLETVTFSRTRGGGESGSFKTPQGRTLEYVATIGNKTVDGQPF